MYRVYRARPGCWVLHCTHCGTREECGQWQWALELIPGHRRFWHGGAPWSVAYPERYRGHIA
jgi:hypothetical protein